MPLALDIVVLPDLYSVCRLPADCQTPEWARGAFLSLTRTPEALSVVCPQQQVPTEVQREGDWRVLRVGGPLDFGMTGVLAALANPLAAAGISIFVVSTFDTDYLLIKQARLRAACRALRLAGHQVAGV